MENVNQLLSELEYRGFKGSTLGNIKELLESGSAVYIGSDPSSIKKDNRNPKFPQVTSSLHIGHLAAFQAAHIFAKYGVKVIVLTGDFTSKFGDPSGKTEARDVLSFDEIDNNAKCIEEQFHKLFSDVAENVTFVRNGEWMDNVTFVDFMRNVGSHLTVNYLMAKDSVKQRFERDGVGISLLEFMYQTIQAADFVHLYEKHNCKIQLAGLDQIGNTTTGIELARKSKGITDMGGYFIPLVTDENGKKFGKSENNKAVFLDSRLTSVYDFYQFWINQSDSMSEQLIKKFTFLSREEIETIIEEHRKAPHLRILQKALAAEVTKLVHSEEELNVALATSEVLFGNPTKETLESMDEKTLVKVFEGVPTFKMERSAINTKFLDVAVNIGAFKSKGDLRKLIQSGGVSINKTKVSSVDTLISENDLLHNKYITLQKGKKVNMLVEVI